MKNSVWAVVAAFLWMASPAGGEPGDERILLAKDAARSGDRNRLALHAPPTGHPLDVAIYSTFLQRAYDCIHHDVCLQDLPVIFCMDRAGLSANDGPTHHGLFDIAYLRCLPNVIAMAPKDEDDTLRLRAAVPARVTSRFQPKVDADADGGRERAY